MKRGALSESYLKNVEEWIQFHRIEKKIKHVTRKKRVYLVDIEIIKRIHVCSKEKKQKYEEQENKRIQKIIL